MHVLTHRGGWHWPEPAVSSCLFWDSGEISLRFFTTHWSCKIVTRMQRKMFFLGEKVKASSFCLSALAPLRFLSHLPFHVHHLPSISHTLTNAIISLKAFKRERGGKKNILICHYRLGSVSSAAIFLAAFHFRLRSELSEQVIGGFEPKTDQICQWKKKKTSCLSEERAVLKQQKLTDLSGCVCVFSHSRATACASHHGEVAACFSHLQHLCSHSDLRRQSQLKAWVLESLITYKQTHSSEDICSSVHLPFRENSEFFHIKIYGNNKKIQKTKISLKHCINHLLPSYSWNEKCLLLSIHCSVSLKILKWWRKSLSCITSTLAIQLRATGLKMACCRYGWLPWWRQPIAGILQRKDCSSLESVAHTSHVSAGRSKRKSGDMSSLLTGRSFECSSVSG